MNMGDEDNDKDKNVRPESTSTEKKNIDENLVTVFDCSFNFLYYMICSSPDKDC